MSHKRRDGGGDPVGPGRRKKRRKPPSEEPSGCAKCRSSERGCRNCQGPEFVTKQELCGLLGITVKEYNQLEKQRDTTLTIAEWEASLHDNSQAEESSPEPSDDSADEYYSGDRKKTTIRKMLLRQARDDGGGSDDDVLTISPASYS